MRRKKIVKKIIPPNLDWRPVAGAPADVPLVLLRRADRAVLKKNRGASRRRTPTGLRRNRRRRRRGLEDVGQAAPFAPRRFARRHAPRSRNKKKQKNRSGAPATSARRRGSARACRRSRPTRRSPWRFWPSTCLRSRCTAAGGIPCRLRAHSMVYGPIAWPRAYSMAYGPIAWPMACSMAYGPIAWPMAYSMAYGPIAWRMACSMAYDL